MSISKDLFLAILSMDSYNRGYGSGIAGLGGENTSIGNATIGKDAEQVLAQGTAEAAGFYAVAYTLDAAVGTMASGTTIISYRGTDFAPDADFWTDVANGWAFGAGDFRAPQSNHF